MLRDFHLLMRWLWYPELGLLLQGNLLMAVDFVYRHKDCLFDVALLSTVSYQYTPISCSGGKTIGLCLFYFDDV